jgi:predicted alpha/beta superfamily hydrolase
MGLNREYEMPPTRVRICAALLLAILLPHRSVAAPSCSDGQTDTAHVHSIVLAQDRAVLVRLPKGYCESTSRYPVLYMMDGDKYLDVLRGTIDFLIANDRIPPLIVVGLTHPDRNHDLTPTSASALTSDGRPSPLPTSGGGQAFRTFIATELIPFVDRQYRTAPYRVLFGHSFGGLFAVDVMLTQPDLFHAYIAASPSVWWDNEYEIHQLARAIEESKVPHTLLYLSIANESDISRNAFAQFLERARSQRNAGLYVVSQTFDDEEHASSLAPAFYGGLKAVFAGWPIPRDANSRIPLGGLEGLEASYSARGRILGYPVAVPEDAYVSLGNQSLAMGRVTESIEAFQRALERYPQSLRARDGLAAAREARNRAPAPR